MIFLDVFLYIYLFASMAAFLLVIVFDYVTGTGTGLGYCISDSCFVYIFVPLLQIGNALVSKHFQIMQLHRIGNKNTVAKTMVFHNLAVSFAVTCIYFSMMVLYRTFIIRTNPVDYEFLESFVCFWLGAVLLVCLTTGVRFAVPSTVEQNVPMMVWLFAVIELKTLIPVFERQSFMTPNLCFSWLFHGTAPWNYSAIVVFCALASWFIMFRATRRDWM